MNPSDPEQPAQPAENAETAPATVPEGVPLAPQTPWGFTDVFAFIFLIFPSLLLAFLVVRLIALITPFYKPMQQLLLAQLIWYALIFTSLYFLLHLRYGLPFWRTLGWKPPSFGRTVFSLFGGPILAATIGVLGAVLHTPDIELPFQLMLSDRTTIILTGLFVVVLGPLCEELAFRGFLLPVFVRYVGAFAGIILTGLLFGLAHGYEYEWSWRHILLIATAGSIFGWIRYRTGSTAAAAFMHSTFNLAQFVAFLTRAHTL